MEISGRCVYTIAEHADKQHVCLAFKTFDLRSYAEYFYQQKQKSGVFFVRKGMSEAFRSFENKPG